MGTLSLKQNKVTVHTLELHGVLLILESLINLYIYCMGWLIACLFSALVEISKLLNTGLDPESLAICVKLCEAGVNPEALASVVQELRREAASLQVHM